MRKSLLLSLLKVIKNNKEISSKLDRIFDADFNQNYGVFLNFTDRQIERILSLSDSNLQFYYIFIFMKYMGICNKDKMEQVLNSQRAYELSLNEKILLRQDALEILSTVASIKNPVQAEFASKIAVNPHVLDKMVMGDFVRMIASIKDESRVSYIEQIIDKNQKLLMHEKSMSIINMLANNVSESRAKIIGDTINSTSVLDSEHAYQLLKAMAVASTDRRASDIAKLLKSRKILEHIDVLEIINAILCAKCDKRADYAIEATLEPEVWNRASIVSMIALANGVIQAEYALRLVKMNKFGVVEAIANAKGIAQTKRAFMLAINKKVTKYPNARKLITAIASADEDYKAGYASLILTTPDMMKHKDIEEIIELILEAKGPTQTECASYVAVNKEVLESGYTTSIVKFVADAEHDYGAEYASMVAMDPLIIERHDAPAIVESVAKASSIKRTIQTVQLLHDEILMGEMDASKYIRACAFDDEDFDVPLINMMDFRDLDLIIDSLSSVKGSSVTPGTSISGKRILSNLKKRRPNG